MKLASAFSFYCLTKSAYASDPARNNGEYITCSKDLDCYDKIEQEFNKESYNRNGNRDSSVIIQRDTTLKEFLGMDVNSQIITEGNGLTNPKPRFGMQLLIGTVANYGCWCYGGAEWPTGDGRGDSRDDFDEACKAHHMGFDCIIMDAARENKVCIPDATSYDVRVIRPASAYGDFVLECSDSIEDDWCKRRTCLVELRLLGRYWKLIQDGHRPDYNTWGHTTIGGPFEPLDSCPPIRTAGGLPREKVCCGEYPYRAWHYSIVGQPDRYPTQCCTYEDPNVTADYGFPITIGALYNQRHEACGPTGPYDL